MDRAVCEVQAPTVGRDKLHRAIANFTSPKIKSVEGSIRRDYVKNAGAAIGHRRRRDPVWIKERALDPPLPGSTTERKVWLHISSPVCVSSANTVPAIPAT